MIGAAERRDGADFQILESKIGSLYQQFPIVLTVNLVNAALVTGVLGSYLHDPRWWLFFGSVAILTVARGLLWIQYRWRKPQAAHAPRWAMLATAGSSISGLIWGIAGAWLFPSDLVAQTFLSFVIGGMCAGALVSLSYHLPAFVGYVVPATLPLAARFLLQGGAVNGAMSAMVLVYATALTVAAYNLKNVFERTVRLQLELRGRSDDLTAANARLETEVSERRSAEDQLRQAQKMEALGQPTGGILALAVTISPWRTRFCRGSLGDFRASPSSQAVIATPPPPIACQGDPGAPPSCSISSAVRPALLRSDQVHEQRILAGGRVTVEMTPYDLTKGRVTFRHKAERASGPSSGRSRGFPRRR